PLLRKIILQISRRVTRMLYRVKVSDPHNGYRIYTLETIKKIQLTADGMHYANEVNEQIKQLKLQFVEVPVYITYTDYSLGKGQKNSNSIKL
ncbi:MAG: glycosyltransferase family 2 protein, partial [Candidatus Peribacteria bacterium]|nr:glycosyltransferase family 2 protein [Candidatus Peribacteria bacterium]